MESETFDFPTNKEEITLGHLEHMCKAVYDQRAVCDEIAAKSKEANTKLNELEHKLIELLKLAEKTSYDSKLGKFGISHRISVKLPQDEDRSKFYEYLKAKGIFESMVTVNHNTLNAFYKSEFAKAQENGEALDFSIPGVGEPTIMEILSVRKA